MIIALYKVLLTIGDDLHHSPAALATTTTTIAIITTTIITIDISITIAAAARPPPSISIYQGLYQHQPRAAQHHSVPLAQIDR